MNIEFVTLSIYFILLLIAGAIFSRFNRSLGDFVRGGGRATWWMVGTSITMAGISAFTFTGNGSAAYEVGPSVLYIYAANILGLLLGALVLGRWYRQTRGVTTADVVRGRFGTAAEQFGILVGMVLNPLTSAVQLWALAVFVGSVFGYPVGWTIALIGVVTVAYSISGGAWAVMATDVIQGAILFGVTLLIAVLALIKIGGFEGFMTHFEALRATGDYAWIKPSAESDGNYTWQWALAVFTMQFVGQIHLGQAGRYLATKDGREASRAAAWACLLMVIGSLIWFIPPMVARMLFATEVAAVPIADPATAAYAVAARELLPTGLMGLMVAAMFSATMSSLDTGLTATTGAILNNLVPRIRERMGRAPIPEALGLRLCRYVTLGLGAYIVALALLLASQERIRLFDLMLNLASLIGGPLGLPLLAGMVIRRLPPGGYFIIFGCAMTASMYTVLDTAAGGTWTLAGRSLAVLVGAGAGVLVCLLLRKSAPGPHRQREAEFFQRMETPVDFERETGGALDKPHAILTGRLLLAVGGLIALFLFLPNTAGERLAIAGLASFIAAAGGGLMYLGRSSPEQPSPASANADSLSKTLP